MSYLSFLVTTSLLFSDVRRPENDADASCTGTRRRSGRALTGTRTCGRHNLLITPTSIFTFYISFEYFLYFSIFLHFLRTDFNLIWNDTTHVQILFINWLRVVVWCCSFLCLFVCLFAKYALRVPPAVTRLTVYRRLRVLIKNGRNMIDPESTQNHSRMAQGPPGYHKTTRSRR